MLKLNAVLKEFLQGNLKYNKKLVLVTGRLKMNKKGAFYDKKHNNF